MVPAQNTYMSLWRHLRTFRVQLTLLIAVVLLLLFLPYLMRSSLAEEQCYDHSGNIPQTEYDALMALYNSTNGPAWVYPHSLGGSPWTSNDSPCSWYGIRCETQRCSQDSSKFAPAHVTQIILNTRLDGSIPAEIGDLSRLEILRINGAENTLSGSIPPELGNLSQLTSLDLGSNNLSNAIPKELGNLALLKYLTLSHNELSGPIPPELGNLSNLIDLELMGNQLCGAIPVELAQLTKLEILSLMHNNLSTDVQDPALLSFLDTLDGPWWKTQLGDGSCDNVCEIRVSASAAAGDGLRLASQTQTTQRICSISDLRSSPGPQAGQVKLTWTQPTAPAGNWSSSARYEVRYSNTPINDKKLWDTAPQVKPCNGHQIPHPNDLPIDQKHAFVACDASSTPFTTSRHWYFAIRIVDGQPQLEWSNIPSLIDTGFRPKPNGYSFKNSKSFSGSYTIEDMRHMYGDQAICQWRPYVFEADCRPRYSALGWKFTINTLLYAGACEGIPVTSLRYYKNIDKISVNSTVHDLLIDDRTVVNDAGKPLVTTVRRNVAYFFAKQFMESVIRTKIYYNFSSPKTALEHLISHMKGDDPATLYYRYEGKQGVFVGHNVVPYAIQTLDESGHDGEHYIWIYDNNKPGNSDVFITIDTNQNKWFYGRLSGSSGTIGVVNISKYATGSFIDVPWLPIHGGSVVSTGDFQILVTDATGQRVGNTTEGMVSEIPEAAAHPIIGGLESAVGWVFSLPLDDEYKITINGPLIPAVAEVETATAEIPPAEIIQFGPGYATGIANITSTPGMQNELTIAPDGTSVTYRVTDADSPTLILTFEGEKTSMRYQFLNTTIGANESVSASIQAEAQQLVFSHTQAGGGSYRLQIDQADTEGERSFTSTTIEIAPGATHYIDYGGWDGSGPLTLGIDDNSDGVINWTVLLETQQQIFLPLLTR